VGQGVPKAWSSGCDLHDQSIAMGVREAIPESNMVDPEKRKTETGTLQCATAITAAVPTPQFPSHASDFSGGHGYGLGYQVQLRIGGKWIFFRLGCAVCDSHRWL